VPRRSAPPPSDERDHCSLQPDSVIDVDDRLIDSKQGFESRQERLGRASAYPEGMSRIIEALDRPAELRLVPEPVAKDENPTGGEDVLDLPEDDVGVTTVLEDVDHHHEVE
jgi:hypothetical protein